MLIGKSRSYYGTSRFYGRCTKQTSFVNSEEVSFPPLTERETRSIRRNALDPLRGGIASFLPLAERARNAHDPLIGKDH